MITRRTALAGVAALSLSRRVRAEATEQRSVNSGADSLPLTRYAANLAGRRPGVIVRHGARGIEVSPAPMSVEPAVSFRPGLAPSPHFSQC